MTRPRRLLIMAAVVVIAALLAFPLRETIYDMVVIPIAFIGWQLGLMYRSFSQVIWWWLAIGITFIILMFSLVPRIQPAPREQPKPKPRNGQVEDLAIWLGRARNGTYFKWLIANRLGKLAFQMLVHRESGRPRTVFTPLVGTDWEPSPELRKYLETGLHGSFSDFPGTRRGLAPQPKTPLDYEVKEAVEFLESRVKDHHLPESH
jgi:hypothetical protein